jgi:hypothetical protein
VVDEVLVEIDRERLFGSTGILVHEAPPHLDRDVAPRRGAVSARGPQERAQIQARIELRRELPPLSRREALPPPLDQMDPRLRQPRAEASKDRIANLLRPRAQRSTAR